MSGTSVRVFDGHNDTLLRLVLAKNDGTPSGEEVNFTIGSSQLHIDLAKAKAGGFGGGLFAMFTPNLPRTPAQKLSIRKRHDVGEKVPHAHALALTQQMIDCAENLVSETKGIVQICTDADQIETCMKSDKIALVLHIEGAEAIDAEFASLDLLYDRGLRSIGPVWSRNNLFANGVPFDFPSSPDHGPGLTALGRELVRKCNKKGIMLDLSHMNEKGFWDVAEESSAPLVASHSNVHALCPTPRNLTDRQLHAIRQSNGLVGLNFAVGFLRTDGNHNGTDMPISRMMTHLDYLLDKLGEDCVALGSDFDGCKISEELVDASGLQKLIDAMRAADYGEALIAKICNRNWMSLLKRTLVA